MAEILHVFVVGFHHKKGCQLEFSYPPLDPLPEQWKHLPTLAMPDGAHNFDKDTVYFHMPSKTQTNETVFGVSCFQQIPLTNVKNPTADMTRSSVQKAVCVLFTRPLYGYIQVKMELITATFFDGGDFSDTSLLIKAYHHLKDCLPNSLETHLYDRLSVTDLLLKFKRETLMLFKLLLLERKVVLFNSPVEPLCTSLISLLSLHPGLLQSGLHKANCASPKGSPISETAPLENSFANETSAGNSGLNDNRENGTEEKDKSILVNGNQVSPDDERSVISESPDSTKSRFSGWDLNAVSNLDISTCGLPLDIFGKGNLCFPYLSISYLDFLSSPGVRGFVVGATNVLFKQKRNLADVVIGVDEGRIDTHCPELRRQLTLSTEDLRFMEAVIKNLEDNQEYSTETWIRNCFLLYITSMLRTSLLPDGSRELDSFNPSFMAAWKLTHNYKMWASLEHSAILQLGAGHPSSGALSVQDFKLKISHAMQSSESGRRLNQAVASTGRAVGGAVTQAKGALVGWWNSVTQETKSPATTIEEI